MKIRTDFDEKVELQVGSEAAQHLSLADAVRCAIALPQKAGVRMTLVRRGKPPIETYPEIVELYGRTDFPS